MAYTPYHDDWHNEDEGTDTPITAEALEYIEQGIVDAAAAADALQPAGIAGQEFAVWNGSTWERSTQSGLFVLSYGYEAHGGGLWARGVAATDIGLGMWLPGDASDRFDVLINGTLRWSDGSGVIDTLLYRLSAGSLKTDGQFTARGNFGLDGAASTDLAFAAWVSGEAQDHFEIYVDGKHWWGDGVNPPDANLYRASADVLATDDSLQVWLPFYAAWNGSDWAFDVNGSGFVNLRGAAKITFNDDASAALSNPSAGVLEVSGNLEVDGDLTVSGSIIGGGLSGGAVLTALNTFTGKNNGSFAAISMNAESWDDIGLSDWTAASFATVTDAGKYEVSAYGVLSGQSGDGGGNIRIDRYNSSGVFVETIAQAPLGFNDAVTITGMAAFNANDRIVVLTQNVATGTAGSMAGRVSVKQLS